MSEQENLPSQQSQRLAIEASPQRLAIEPPPSIGEERSGWSVDSQGTTTPVQSPELTTPPAPVNPNAEQGANFTPAPPPEADQPEESATSAEKKVNPEQNAEKAREMTTQPVGRLIASTENPEALDTTQSFSGQDAATMAELASHKEPAELPTEKVASQSYKARENRWKDDDRDLEDKAKDWRAGIQRWINKKTNPEHPDATLTSSDKREAITATLESLGLDASDNKIEEFRQKYVHERSSNVEQFAKDLAEGCRVDGKIDLEQLAIRMQATKELFNIFGTHNNVNKLVMDYATAHALLSEAKTDEGVRSAVEEKVIEHLAETVTDPSEKFRLDLLHEETPEPEPEQPSSEAGSDQQTEDDLSDEKLEEIISEARENALEDSARKELADEFKDLITKIKQNKVKEDEQESVQRRVRELNSRLLFEGALTLGNIAQLKRALTLMQEPNDIIEKALSKAKSDLENLPKENSEKFTPLHVIQFTKQQDADGHVQIGYTTNVVPFPKEALSDEQEPTS